MILVLQFIFRGSDQPGFFIHGCTLGNNFDLLKPAPGNAPPSDNPYLCIIPVLDAWRMVKAHTVRMGVRHYANEIEPTVLDDVRAGRAVLVFDLSNEGPVFNHEIFAELHQYAENNALPASRIVWLAQNRAVEAHYRAAFAGRPGEPIGFEYYDFFVKITAWMFSPKAPHPVLGGDTEGYISRLFDVARKDRTLLCLNATPRQHRVLTIAGLIHHGLFDEALVSFPGVAYVKDGGNVDEERLLAFLAANPELSYLSDSCRAALVLKDLRVDAFTETGNALFNKIDVLPYERTYFSVVTETEFTGGEVDRITEKIVKAFCLGHPSVIVGNPHAIRYLTELGFQDFTGVIDRNYEDELSPARRFNCLFEQIIALARDTRQNPDAWLGRVREVGASNVRHASSGRLLDNCVALQDRPVVERLRRRLAVSSLC